MVCCRPVASLADAVTYVLLLWSWSRCVVAGVRVIVVGMDHNFWKGSSLKVCKMLNCGGLLFTVIIVGSLPSHSRATGSYEVSAAQVRAAVSVSVQVGTVDLGPRKMMLVAYTGHIYS